MPETNLQAEMQYLNGSYKRYFDHRYRQVGHLLPGLFKVLIINKTPERILPGIFFVAIYNKMPMIPTKHGHLDPCLSLTDHFFSIGRMATARNSIGLWSP